MTNVYLYRRINFDYTRYPNPYIFNLEDSLSQYFNIVNKNDNKIGVADLFRYLFRTKIFFFNWIEILPQAKLGKFQVVIFRLFLVLAKISGKKVVWTLHNKYSHAVSRNYWTDVMYDILVKCSDLILTHSQAGISFVEAQYPAHAYKTKYIIHPVLEILPVPVARKKKYDFLIWGGIHPYKGIVEFLQFVKNSDEMRLFKILILGRCFNEEYGRIINENLSENVIYRDEFFEIEEIAKFASQSKFILFTYKLTSTLSSGSLMDSIRMRTMIIGPNDAAFKDLSSQPFVYTYNDFDELPQIYKQHAEVDGCMSDMEEFCSHNTWNKFGRKLFSELENIHLLA